MPTSDGTILTSRVGTHTLWSSLLTVVAGAMVPSGRCNTAVDTRPVDRDESDVREAVDVAPVSLTADGIVRSMCPCACC